MATEEREQEEQVLSDEEYFSASENEADNNSDEYKALPSTKSKMAKEAHKLGLLKPNPTLDSGRKILLSHVYSSHKIKRSFKQMSILLIGETGVGKSSTVNHLFNLRQTEGSFMEIAKTSDNESMTRTTCEYLIKATSDCYQVKDLRLGLVDSPGLNDTSGTRQDACNFYSIKRFFAEHPNLEGCLPNLILVSINASDNRTKGSNSALSKTLKLLNKLGLVDKSHPNVVGIITHAVHLGSKPTKFKQELERLTGVLQTAIFEYLQVAAPVVAIENDVKGEELEIEGDWTKLVDGTKQPLNLFTTCKDLLEKSKDPFGQIVFSECFKKCSQPEVGFEIKATDATNEKLSKQEEEFHEYYKSAIEGGVENELVAAAKSFIEQQNLDETKKKLVRKTAGDMISAGFNLESVRQMSIEALSFLIERVDESTVVKDFMLSLGVQNKEPVDVCDSAIRVIGQGYNIISRKTVTSAIFSFGKRNTRNGLLVPDTGCFARANETLEFLEFFESKDEMQKALSQALNINFQVDSKIIGQFQGSGGYNRMKGSKSENSHAEISFLFEQRLFELNLTNLDELKVSDEFVKDTVDLPDDFNVNDETNRLKYELFFQKWGHFLVTRAYGGGSVELKVSEKSKMFGKVNYNDLKVEILSLLSVQHTDNASQKSKEILSRSTSLWKGGDASLHNKNNFINEEAMSKWKISLMNNPVMLEHSLSLMPISEIVKRVERTKSIGCTRALLSFLGGEFKTKEAEVRAEKERQKLDADNQLKQQKNARTRVEAVQASQPGSSGPCFPSTAVVDLLTKEGVNPTQMKDLKIGDLVKTNSDVNAKYQNVITFLHRDMDVTAEFVKITFESGNQLTVTGNHLLLTRRRDSNAISSKPASQVQMGDEDLITIGEGNNGMKVMKVETEWNRGIFCPLTESGTIVVDGVLCSCYASVRSLDFGLVQISGHKLAHLAVTPLRLWRQINSWKSDEEMEKYLKWLQNLRISKAVLL